MARRSTDPDFIEALARGLDVLRAFRSGDPALSLSVISQRVGLTRPTTRRILLTLEELGYIRSADPGYCLTPRVLELGLTYIQSQGLWALVEPHLRALVNKTHESCSIAQLDGSDIVYVARAAVPKLVGLSVHIGTRFPAYATSLGKAILAELDDEELHRALSTPSQSPIVPYWQPTLTEILSDLQEVRTRGWALTDQQLALGIRSIAVALIDHNGGVVGAMNVNASATETSVAHLVDTYLPELIAAKELVCRDINLALSLPTTTINSR